jgi:hypothetical protein
MYVYIMTFVTFEAKRHALHWIKEHIEPDNTDECLMEKKLVFCTGIQVSDRQEKQLLALPHLSYKTSKL